MNPFAITINGKAIAADDHFRVDNPADGSLVSWCPKSTFAQVDEAVSSAHRAFTSWSACADSERAASLMAIADLIDKHHHELSELVTREQGKTQSGPGANMEVGAAVAWTRATAGLSFAEEVIQDDSSARIAFTRRPVGVVASITPWNWPLMIAVWHIMPALRVGCTVVIKPSPFTPLSTLRLVSLMNEVLPAGVINVVTGGADLGSYLVSHAQVSKITFTGSIATGRAIMALAAQSLKRLTLELGGNDAGIILPRTQISPLVEKLFWGCFINAGQTCAALKRLYVHEEQYNEVVEQLAAFIAKIPVGNGLDPKNLIGPVSNKQQRDKIIGYVKDAENRGASLICGGVSTSAPGFFYPLTILGDATDDMRVVNEEQFGPVIPILKYRTVEEAIARANSLDVGLGGSVWGDDADEASIHASRLDCGTAWVNQHGALHPLAPFGGIKSSGIGVEFNIDGLKEYTTIRVLSVAR